MPLEARNLSFRYGSQFPWILQNVNLQVERGERVALLGPSGYGKSTLASLLAHHETPTSGQVYLDGKPISRKGINPVQLICQHPETAINPRWKMQQVLDEAGGLSPTLMQNIGIRSSWLSRYPAELSGGELQRFCIARALGAGTQYLIADEITTMLDTITQAQIWHLLLEQAALRNLGLVIITHSPALAQRLCTRTVELPLINAL